MSKRKLLIHEVFEQGKLESGKETKSGIALYLWTYFEEKLGLKVSDKTLVRYYEAFLEKGNEVNIEPYKLDKMSQYIGYKDFKDFSNTSIKRKEDAEFTTVKVSVDEDEESISERLSKIIINITNKPVFNIPEFFTKQSNLGIVGVLLVGGFFAGNKIIKDKKEVLDQNRGVIEKTAEVITTPVGFSGFSEEKSSTKTVTGTSKISVLRAQDCMYWDEDHYVQTFCNDQIEGKALVAYKTEKAKLKKNTRPDTLTVDNAFGKVWYLKNDNKVEFFNSYGEHPENGETLKKATKYIIEKYGKQETPE